MSFIINVIIFTYCEQQKRVFADRSQEVTKPKESTLVYKSVPGDRVAEPNKQKRIESDVDKGTDASIIQQPLHPAQKVDGGVHNFGQQVESLTPLEEQQRRMVMQQQQNLQMQQQQMNSMMNVAQISPQQQQNMMMEQQMSMQTAFGMNGYNFGMGGIGGYSMQQQMGLGTGMMGGDLDGMISLGGMGGNLYGSSYNYFGPSHEFAQRSKEICANKISLHMLIF